MTQTLIVNYLLLYLQELAIKGPGTLCFQIVDALFQVLFDQKPIDSMTNVTEINLFTIIR